MNIKKFTIHFITTGIVIYGAYTAYYYFKKQPTGQLFKTEQPQKKTIKHVISAAGVLEIKDVMKIGSMVSGTIKKVCVKENQHVTKGQILAIVDLGKNDTDIKAAQARVEKAQQELSFQKKLHQRQKALFESGQLSINNFERITTDYKKAKADLDAEIAGLDKAKLELVYANITTPTDGIVTVANATTGIAVIPDFTYILFEIAHDITKMRATLDIDESEVGYVKAGLKAHLSFNAFPELDIKAPIKEISYTPKGTGKKEQPGIPFYKAVIDIDNNNRILRPGMVITAQINIAKAKNTLSLSGLAFQINPDAIIKIAQQLNYSSQAINPKDLKLFKQKNKDKSVRTVWVVKDKSFIQKPIIVGITDNTLWQIISGLQENEQVLVDVCEPGELDKLYKAWFKGIF